jgi:hypothetical protein
VARADGAGPAKPKGERLGGRISIEGHFDQSSAVAVAATGEAAIDEGDEALETDALPVSTLRVCASSLARQ